jgi:tetratricopeptide (TPR) repeat protein
MDPLSQALADFQTQFRDFRENSKARLLLILCDPAQAGALAKTLRGEEWQPDNQSPFLIFDTAYAEPPETFKTMNATVVGHYNLLQKELAQEGLALPVWNLQLTGKEEPVSALGLHVKKFHDRLKPPLQGLYVCWLPTRVENGAAWQKDVLSLLNLPLPPSVRFVFSDVKDGLLAKQVAAMGEKAAIVEYHVDEKKMADYFKQMSTNSGGKPHPGTMPGSARPDVEPPPRPHSSKPPSEDDLRAMIAAGQAQPMLLPSQGEKLRQLVLEAAEALKAGRQDEAIQRQTAACALCAEAGVKLEQALMTLVLANYFVQFNLPEKAAQKFREAAALADEVNAYPQVAQARLAHAYFLLKSKLPEQAAPEYELAADAALKGQATMLRIEALRMAGTCYLQSGKKPEASRCWQMAVAAGEQATPGEIRTSSLPEVGKDLIKLLREQKLETQARSVEKLIAGAAEKVRNEQPQVRT